MRYRTLTGYDSIIALEAEKSLQEIQKQYQALADGVEFEVLNSAKPGKYPYRKDMTVGDLVNDAGGLVEGKNLKAVHIGYPVGGVFKPEVLNEKLGIELFDAKKLCPGSFEVHLIYDDSCMADYYANLAVELQNESCGRCVYCREGLRQTRLISDQIVKAKGLGTDLALEKDIFDGMEVAAQCLYGKSVGHLLNLYLENFGAEIDQHISAKKCPANYCKQFMTYHILGSKCVGCTDCLDACDEDAIEGKKGYIHVIDNYYCTRCGACKEACEHDAIVTAGSIKPRTPDEPIRVGTWRGR